MRDPLESYAKKWLAPQADGTVTSEPPDMQSLVALCHQEALEPDVLPVDDYPLSLQIDRLSGLMVAGTADNFSLRKWVDRTKEAVSFAKDLLDVVLKLSPLGLIPPAMMLALYLRRMGWSELLLESLGSASGLITLLGYVSLFMLLSMMQFCLPSAAVAPLSKLLGHQKQDARLRIPMTLLCLGLPFVWSASFGVCVLQWPNLGALSPLIATLVALIADVAIVIWLKMRMSSSEGWKSYLIPSRLLGIGAFSLLGALFSVFPLLVLIRAVEKQSMSNDHPILVLLGCAIVSAFGVLPGFLKTMVELSGQTSRQAAMATLGALLGVGYIVGAIVWAVTPVSAYVLAASGVYSSHASVYQLRKPELAAAFRAAHMPVYAAHRSEVASVESPAFVGAFLRYNFGGAKLLCKFPFDPSVVTQSDIDYARQNEKPDPYLRAGNDCVPVKADEVTPIHGNSI